MADPKVKYEVYEVFETPLVEESAAAGPSQPEKRLDVHLLCELHNPVRPT